MKILLSLRAGCFLFLTLIQLAAGGFVMKLAGEMGVLRLALSRSNCCPSRSSGLMMLALV